MDLNADSKCTSSCSAKSTTTVKVATVNQLSQGFVTGIFTSYRFARVRRTDSAIVRQTDANSTTRHGVPFGGD
jgi:hypothetical protein